MFEFTYTFKNRILQTCKRKYTDVNIVANINKHPYVNKGPGVTHRPVVEVFQSV